MSKPPQPRKKREEDDLEIQLATVRRKISDEEAEIAELYNLQDAPKKYTRENYLEIHRVPESANTSTEEGLQPRRSFKCVYKFNHVEISHKLHMKGIKPIIAKFQSHKVKARM